jgi:hypothetical protein
MAYAKIYPEIGSQFFLDRLGLVTVTQWHPLGTYDVVDAKGNYYRVSGFPLNQK